MVNYVFRVREVRGWAECQDRRKRAEVQERGGVWWGSRAAFGVGGAQEMEAVSAALPDFDCLINTACHHVGSSLVKIQRGNKVFMGTQGLHAAFVLVVPDPKGFVISTAHYESSSRMNQYPTHPVVMTHQSHKADANADVPHLDCFIPGSREKEGARFSTLLAL